MAVECPFYLLEASGPWGDFGAILWHGFALNSKESLEIYRCGPVCPPVMIVADTLVIRELLMDEFVATFGNGYQIQNVILKKVVDLNWHEWDITSSMPPVYPGGDGEPEDYVMTRRHSKALAASMGKLIAIHPTQCGATVDSVRTPIPGSRLTNISYSVRKGTWSGSDLFRGRNVVLGRDVGFFCTQKMKVWIEKCCGASDTAIYFEAEPCNFS